MSLSNEKFSAIALESQLNLHIFKPDASRPVVPSLKSTTSNIVDLYTANYNQSINII